ncbi:hypothetical protein KUTeg_017530 [Tegillarca granosa]|uniref:Sema domain-containing protein n=1 Tax=Tegillarca granosa TaxID=220873 RepID=A0ABQ9EJ26_TEGGR|nr:hypothetical protein KUTeg_017530 [Tegillarca granosa]
MRLHRTTNMTLWINFLFCVFLLFGICILDVGANSCKSCNELTPKELKPKIYPEPGTNNKLQYFRYLMENKSLPVETQKKRDCLMLGKQEVPDCQNHIRFIARNESKSGQLYVCGTGAYNPIGYADNSNVVGSAVGVGVCSTDPSDNSTAVFVEYGNPGNVSALYSATISSFFNFHIFRPKLYNRDGTVASGRMQSVDINAWMNNPQYVGSFDVGDKVLFFFRETALEFYNYERKIVSRVAKVCKKDRGGRSLLQNRWTSYQKARLNCSIPGEFPYYFDEIQDVVTVDHNTFYGLFTTNVNGLTASAICAYTLEDIQASFDGLFKEQVTEDDIWQTVPKEKEPSCSIEDSLELPSDALSFFRLRPLMDKAVMHKYGKPIYYKGGLQMTRLAVIPNINEDPNNLLFFASSNNGDVYKIFTRTDNSMFKTRLSSKYNIFNSPRPIWSMKIHDKQLYLGTDEEVVQIGVQTCSQYTKIDSCANDPFCAWSKLNSRCDDIDTYEENAAEQLYKPKNFIRNVSSSVTFEVDYNLCTSDRKIRWTFQRDADDSEVDVHYNNTHQLTTEDSLIITEVSSNDNGTYRAKDVNNKVLSLYTLNVMDGIQAIEQVWIDQFEQWSDMFEKQKQKNCAAP